MRKLTFPSFLARYLKELSVNETSAPFKLTKELDHNLRLLAPLCLYAACTMNDEQLEKLFRRSEQVRLEFEARPFLRGSPALPEDFLPQLPDANDPYRKCWKSYVSVRDRYQSELHPTQLMVKKIRQLQAQLGLSNYRIYRDLGLNPGNANAFLTHGDCTKVSLNTARRTLQYLQQQVSVISSKSPLTF